MTTFRALLFILIATCLLAVACGRITGEDLRAVDGVMDLSGWDAAGDGPVALNGTWDFYWNAFITPEQFTGGSVDTPALAVQVPGTWNHLLVDGRPISGQGRATYRLRLHLATMVDDLGLKLLDAATACQVFVNGKNVFTQGHPGENRNASIPAFTPGVVRLPPIGPEVDIVIWVSNFHHRLGGVWEPVRLDVFQDLVRERESRAGHRWFLFGAILIIGVYQLGLYVSRRQERAPLYFGLFCLAVAARSLTTGERIIMTLAPGLDWGLLEKVEYISFYLCVPLFGLVLRALFADLCSRRLITGVGAIALALTAVVLVTPARVFSYTMAPFQWLTLALLGYGVAVLAMATRRHLPGALPLLLGFAALAAAGANDILYSRLIIQSVYMLPAGLFVFIMSQALVLSNRYADAFNILDRQRQALETANRNLGTEIKERERAERAVKAERDTLDIITRSMGAGLVAISPEYTTIWANSVIKDIFGDVEGKPCHLLYNQRDDICPDCGVKEVFETGKEMVLHEQEGKDINGNPIWAEIIATPIRREDGSVAAALELVVPITQRKQAEVALKESEERFRQMAENLREVVWLATPDSGRFLYVSPAFEAIWKQPVTALLADPQAWYAPIHPGDVDRVRDSRVKHLLGNTTRDEFRLIWPDGTIRWVINRTYPVAAADGTISRLVGIAEDVTRRVQQRKEKENLERRLHHARRMETIATLAGGVAHQFNDALDVIIKGIGLLKTDLPTTDLTAGAALERMARSAQRMTGFTDQLFTYAQEGTSTRTALTAGKLLEQVLTIVRHTVTANIVISPDDGAETAILVDTTQMQMAISAVLMNAAEAIGVERSDGLITVEATRITNAGGKPWLGNAVPAGTYAQITITDNGAGMDTDTLERVFEPFFSTKLQGRGLGMAAVFGIVAHHNGFLAVDSSPGKGTTVRILLPAAAAARQVPTSKQPTDADRTATPRAPAEGETILLVEDEPIVREINHQLLETIGYRVLDAENGRAALALAKKHKQRISLVLLDIHLPDIPGKRLLPLLKGLLPEAKMVICSGGSADGLLEKGAHGFLQKPFSLKKLSAALADIRSGNSQ